MMKQLDMLGLSACMANALEVAPISRCSNASNASGFLHKHRLGHSTASRSRKQLDLETWTEQMNTWGQQVSMPKHLLDIDLDGTDEPPGANRFQCQSTCCQFVTLACWDPKFHPP